ncbi:beta-propeller fold lactonase family protein [Robbsia sp. Bb-Pol-6]|uniref:Beta-propeller fold lactonase family protein n=1 Tax=Robbsia betulipollinis TaxID=2981849 RepID=A0ABT3ZKJ5_9BURK|nr:beta-propeller fold lactonase family protein [Robbsia betulipollinis]MCY0386947.1 beta-propeller fold lactonase family protein [Robbsia betulipollinis]
MNQFVLVSNAEDGHIGVFHLEGASGVLRPLDTVAAGEVVMPLALSRDQRTVFAATRGRDMTLVTFAVDATNGSLTRRQTRAIAHSHAYLATDRAGRYVFGASYGQNMLGVYAPHRQAAPLQVVEGIAHAHCVVVSADDRFAYVSALGGDRILCFRIGDDAACPLHPVDSIALAAGFGPRHLRFSPCGRYLYALSEFRGIVAVLERDPETGRLTWRSASPRPPALAHLRDGVARPNFDAPVQPDPRLLATSVWAADLQVHPGGQFLYASERTASLLLIYRVRAENGSLDCVGAMETEKQPRGFKIDPTGTFLLACGERSAHVAVYRIDSATGLLERVSRAPGGRGANWIELVEQTDIAKNFQLESER